jgi:hypothetical protein
MNALSQELKLTRELTDGGEAARENCEWIVKMQFERLLGKIGTRLGYHDPFEAAKNILINVVYHFVRWVGCSADASEACAVQALAAPARRSGRRVALEQLFEFKRGWSSFHGLVHVMREGSHHVEQIELSAQHRIEFHAGQQQSQTRVATLGDFAPRLPQQL